MKQKFKDNKSDIFHYLIYSLFLFPPFMSFILFYISLFLYFLQGHGMIKHPLAAFSTPKFVFCQFLRSLHFCTGFWWSNVSVFCDPVAPYLKMQTLNMFWLNLALTDIKQPSNVEYTQLLCSLNTFTMSKLEGLRKLSRAWPRTWVVTFIFFFLLF